NKDKEGLYILDVGANIGNHSLYFALECKATKILAFEPICSTFEILEKNIVLNHLQNIITPLNVGLSNKSINASIVADSRFGNTIGFHSDNIGGTNLTQDENGAFKLIALDSINLKDYGFERLDFIKIDVENHEIEMLEGALETLKKYRPIIFIETFKDNKEKVFGILNGLGYQQVKSFPFDNYLFAPKEDK
ncbi:FkbM family methyltransferase, partial [Helicobacter cetorum]|uniref:FkbM family methyltransferase n=1 Tax=Helicobacter cetorum TaxID=138563 RepID=UPI001F000F2E